MIYPKSAGLPQITTTQMIEVDRRMIEDVGISLFQMMENAGLQLASLARDLFLGGDVSGKRVAIIAGAGGNGGGAITAARRLSTWGASCDIGLSRVNRALAPVPQPQLDILTAISSPQTIAPGDLNNGYDLIIDGLIGYSLQGTPEGRAAALIHAANAANTPTLSLDVPSGFDGQTGGASEICTRAAATLTLALPKIGMLTEQNKTFVGKLFCADISCPAQVFEGLGLKKTYQSPFRQGQIVEVV